MPKKDTLTSSSNSDSDSEDEKKLKAKLRKEQQQTRKRKHEPQEQKVSKKSNIQTAETDANSNEKILLGKMKFVDVRTFNGKVLIDIREHYQKDGEIKPGRKGISLSTEQWEKLKMSMEEVDSRIQQL
uniref:Activated RNA polymerase II transcriptional coactivator p15 n=1 Tax=Ciona savignyi TaxID=51511 RepID=H2ZF47_CIOSA